MIWETEDCAVVGQDVYFILKKINLICKWNMKSLKTEIISCIPQEGILQERLCARIAHWNEKLIFVPMNAKRIWIYSLAAEEWHSIALPGYEDDPDKMMQAILLNDVLYMIGCRIPAIFILDLRTESLRIIAKPFERMKKKADSGICFRRDCVLKDGTLFLASCLDNTVVKFHIEAEKVEFLRIGSAGNRYSGIAWDGNYFWLAPRGNRPIVRWDGGMSTREYAIPLGGESPIDFLGVTVLENSVFFPGRWHSHSLCISFDDMENISIVAQAYFIYKKSRNGLISLDQNGAWQMKTDIERTFHAGVSAEQVENYFRDNKIKNIPLARNCIMEREEVGVKEFINFLRFSTAL